MKDILNRNEFVIGDVILCCLVNKYEVQQYLHLLTNHLNKEEKLHFNLVLYTSIFARN